MPESDEIEVTLFGRGYGESILIHVGNGNWILVDCLVDKDSSIVPLQYLQSIGVGIDSLKMIVATHWHDDHVRGISGVYEQAKRARFVLPAAMQSDEWNAFHQHVLPKGTKRFSSGVRELENIAEIQRGDPSRLGLELASKNKLLFALDSDLSGHGLDVEVQALAPGSADVLEFYKMLAASDFTGRAEPFSRNDVSIALWIKIGEDRILLGADMENVAHQERGWKGVLSSSAPITGKATLVKIAHHGSSNGHHQPFWDEHVEENAVTALSPWNRSTKLPKKADVERTLALTEKSFSSSPLDGPKTKRSQAVRKTLSKFNVRLETRPVEAGAVQARKKIGVDKDWQINLINSAIHLSELHD